MTVEIIMDQIEILEKLIEQLPEPAREEAKAAHYFIKSFHRRLVNAGYASYMPGTNGFTMTAFNAEKVPQHSMIFALINK